MISLNGPDQDQINFLWVLCKLYVGTPVSTEQIASELDVTPRLAEHWGKYWNEINYCMGWTEHPDEYKRWTPLNSGLVYVDELEFVTKRANEIKKERVQKARIGRRRRVLKKFFGSRLKKFVWSLTVVVSFMAGIAQISGLSVVNLLK